MSVDDVNGMWKRSAGVPGALLLYGSGERRPFFFVQECDVWNLLLSRNDAHVQGEFVKVVGEDNAPNVYCLNAPWRYDSRGARRGTSETSALEKSARGNSSGSGSRSRSGSGSATCPPSSSSGSSTVGVIMPSDSCDASKGKVRFMEACSVARFVGALLVADVELQRQHSALWWPHGAHILHAELQRALKHRSHLFKAKFVDVDVATVRAVCAAEGAATVVSVVPAAISAVAAAAAGVTAAASEVHCRATVKATVAAVSRSGTSSGSGTSSSSRGSPVKRSCGDRASSFTETETASPVSKRSPVEKRSPVRKRSRDE